MPAIQSVECGGSAFACIGSTATRAVSQDVGGDSVRHADGGGAYRPLR